MRTGALAPVFICSGSTIVGADLIRDWFFIFSCGCRSAFAYTDVGTSRSAGMRVSDEGANCIGCGLSRPRGEVLSLACPRESTQRERHPEHSPAKAGPLRSSPIRGPRTTRQFTGLCPVNPLKHGARLFPRLAAVLGECYGRGRSTPRRRSRGSQ